MLNETTGEIPSNPGATAMRLRMLTVFGMQGFVFATLNMRIPDLQIRLGLTDAELGFVLMGGPIGALLMFPFSPRLVAGLGTRVLMAICFCLLSLVAAISTLAPNGILLFAAMVAFGGLNSAADISINVEADRVEAKTGARLMNRCHGIWSIVFFAASSLSGAVRGLGVDPALHLWVVAPLYAAAALFFILPMKEAPARPHTAESRSRFSWPTLAILALAAFGIGGDLFEGASRVWATIYLRDGFDVSAYVEGAALPALVLTMALGRLNADRFIQRFGPIAVGRAALTTAIVGLAIIVTAPHAYIAIFGFAVTGIGVAPIYPLMISSAARLGDRPAAENVASTALVFQLIMLTSPMLIGFVAETYSVRSAYGMLLPLLVLGWTMAGRLR